MTLYLASYDHFILLSLIIIIQCAAAHLNANYMAANPDVHVVEDEDESWIRLGGNASDPKLTQSIADEFTYVMKPPDSAYTIGYEGCWNVSGLGASVMNNFVEVSSLHP
jgi:cytochrome c-type biogenesis protein CcmE